MRDTKGMVIVIGDGLASRALAEALRNAGSPVVFAPDISECIELHPGFIIGDDPAMSPIQPAAPKFGNPRPYLKRKKGRA